MKAFIHLSVMLLLGATGAKAQTWDEIFNQKNTQIKYLTEQIIALKVQIGYIQKGYRVAKDGLDFIGKATKGEFDLHHGFFSSLTSINPEVSRYPRVEQIIRLNDAVVSGNTRFRKLLAGARTLNAAELDYVDAVFLRIEEDCAFAKKELEQIVSEGNFQMEDDERIARIDVLHERMQENYLITARFGQEAVQLSRARLLSRTDIDNSRIIYKIK